MERTVPLSLIYIDFRRKDQGEKVCSEVALIETQRRASAPVTAHLPLTSPCRPTAQLGQQRNLCDPNRQLLTPENANEPGSSALACVRWKSTDTSICLVRGRKEGTGGRGGGGQNGQIGETVSYISCRRCSLLQCSLKLYF